MFSRFRAAAAGPVTAPAAGTDGTDGTRQGRRATGPAPALVAGAVVVVLVAFASGYGYHRDELYFLAAGHHLAWSYADQGPVAPLIARAMSAIGAGSLIVLRVPSAVAAGATVLLTGLLARELGGGRRAALIASLTAAVSTIVLFTGHTLSTSTFDLLAWTALTWLVVRAVHSGTDRLWPVAGLVLGAGLLNKPLPAFLAGAMIAGVALAGPRRLLRNGYVWCAAAIAMALWSPWLIWQARHGWPQLDVAGSITAGGSTSSAPRWAIVPFQALYAGPLLAPVWIAGLVRLFRDRELRDLRFLGWAWVLLAVTFIATGGKPYYLAGLLPLLIGAGTPVVAGWLDRGRAGARRGLLAAAIVISAVVGSLIALPVLPADRVGPIVAMNPDVGETIGWPDLTRTVAGVAGPLPGDRPVIFTGNYGEAGAIDRFGPALGLPHAHSGHNAYESWGPPPDGSAPVITVGIPMRYLTMWFRDCTPRAHITNAAGVDNDERGALIALCRSPREPWSRLWPELGHLG